MRRNIGRDKKKKIRKEKLETVRDHTAYVGERPKDMNVFVMKLQAVNQMTATLISKWKEKRFSEESTLF